MRFRAWFCLALGVAFLLVAGALGIGAIQQATEVAAYHHAHPCPADSESDANCLRAVHGSVAAVTESPGSGQVSADYALDVRTASTTLHLTFSADSPMLGYAVDGDAAVVTMWRGVPVSVVTDGRSDVTTSVPETALAHDIGYGAEIGGLGVLFVFGAFAIRWNRRTGGTPPLTRPVLAAALWGLLLGGTVVMIGGIALGGKPSRLGPDLAATSGALLAALGLSAWIGVSVKRRVSTSAANLVPAQGMANVPVPLQRSAPTTRRPPGVRLPPASRARAVGAQVGAYLPVLLTVAVLFGILFTSHDGPAARAFRHAPACVGETNLAACVGDFTAEVNGVRAPANGANFADVSYVTSDGAINAWVRFDGDAAAIARMATADENARAQLRIRVWRRSIVGAELGGSWHWADGDPPGDTIPAAFLAVSFALLLLVVRVRIRRREVASADGQPLLVEDLSQLAAAVGSVALLADGFWLGAIPAVAVLLWLGLSARRSTQRRRVMLGQLV